MATWIVKPKFKKSITERVFWEKDGNLLDGELEITLEDSQ